MVVDFETIYKENETKIFCFLMRLCANYNLAEELTQKTLYKAFLHIDEFKGKCQISTWLCQIAKNEYFHYLRDEKKFDHINIYDSDKFYEKSNDDDIQGTVEKKEQVCAIINVLKIMESPYRDVFIEKVLMELNYREIARIHDKSDSWARVTYFRAKTKLKERIKGYED